MISNNNRNTIIPKRIMMTLNIIIDYLIGINIIL